MLILMYTHFWVGFLLHDDSRISIKFRIDELARTPMAAMLDCLLPRRRGDYAERDYHADVVMAAVGNHHADTMSHDHCHLSKVNESKQKLTMNLSITYSEYISECKKKIRRYHDRSVVISAGRDYHARRGDGRSLHKLLPAAKDTRMLSKIFRQTVDLK